MCRSFSVRHTLTIAALGSEASGGDLIQFVGFIHAVGSQRPRTELSLSHSPTDQERAWDFGMVDADVIAFPVCKAGEEKQWSAGRLSEPITLPISLTFGLPPA